MITDADIKKMKAVFATKEDLKSIDAKMATKDDLTRFATKEDIDKFTTKKDIQNLTNELVELITSGFDRTEKAIRMISDHDEIINEHERRLDRVEDKVFA
ncbi:conserved hypothetical protein [Candidatus Roizmanbacteria bacterium]|nr:conserved hypothetical protein [Candidatus Roizmanbacteria bacterium]